MSPTAEKPRKRRRDDSDDPTAATTSSGPSSSDAIKHDEEFWFPDGNVVLVASRVAFRVYKGILMKQSEFFSIMFSVPQPAEGASEQIQGCPVVHVTDSVCDVRHLLRALYPTRRNVPCAPSVASFRFSI